MRVAIIILIAGAIGTIGTGCKTQSKLTKTVTQTKIDSTGSLKKNTVSETTTKEYDDTLRTTVLQAPNPEGGQTVYAESKGIKAMVTIIPRRDTTGKIIGNEVKIEAIAKPVSVKESNQYSIVSSQSQVQSTVKSEQKEKVKETPFTLLPRWAWWVIGAGIIIAGIYFIKKYFKFFI